MLVLFRPNGVTTFMSTVYPDLMPVSNHKNPPLLKPRVAASYPDTPLSFIPHAWDSSMAPTSLLFIVVNISLRMTRDNSMTLFGRSVGVLPVIHLIHLLC